MLANTPRIAAWVLVLSYPPAVHVAMWLNKEELAVAALVLLAAGMTLLLLTGKARRGGANVGFALALVVALTAVALLYRPMLPVLFLPVLINAALCMVFGRTLLSGREPLLTRFARLHEPSLPVEVAAYTRTLTTLWSLFFAAMTLESLALASFADRPTWSLFANFLNYLFVAIFFGFEYGYRRWRFRNRVHPPLQRFLAEMLKTNWLKLAR